MAIAVGFSLLGLLLMYAFQDDESNTSVLFPLMTVPLLWRRSAPVGALGAILVAVVALDLLLGSDVVRCLLVPPTAFLLVSVLCRGEGAALVVEVENAPATGEVALAGAGTGNGLRGLRERVGACGGTLEAGPTRAGGWRLSVRLPRRVTAAAS